MPLRKILERLDEFLLELLAPCDALGIPFLRARKREAFRCVPSLPVVVDRHFFPILLFVPQKIERRPPGDGVHPGGESRRRLVGGGRTGDPQEHLLGRLLRARLVPGHPVAEVDHPPVVPGKKLLEGVPAPPSVKLHQFGIGPHPVHDSPGAWRTGSRSFLPTPGPATLCRREFLLRKARTAPLPSTSPGVARTVALRSRCHPAPTRSGHRSPFPQPRPPSPFSGVRQTARWRAFQASSRSRARPPPPPPASPRPRSPG